MAHKPSKTHPWRNSPSSAAVSWAKQQSYVPPVQSVSMASSEGIKRRGTRKKEGGQM